MEKVKKYTRQYFFTVACILFFLSADHCPAQQDNNLFLYKKDIQEADSNRLYLSLSNANFFKNNEYFNNIIEGYTMIGYYINPSLVYYAGSTVRLQAGAHILKYSGLDECSKIVPTFSVHCRLSNGFHLIMGTLYGGLNHRIIEPLYQFERHFENNNENGVQLLIDKQHLNADIWLNWERFIFFNSPFREEFTTGVSSEIKITDSSSILVVSIPLQAVISHKGGQATDSEDKLETLVNGVWGLNIDRNIKHRYIQSAGLSGYYLVYEDWSICKQQRFIDGHALYPVFRIKAKPFHLMLGYWHANEYISPRGEPLFQSKSYMYTFYNEPSKKMLTGKLSYEKNLYHGIDLGVRMEGYYDLLLKNFDFSYGLYIVFNRSFFLSRCR